jgi:GT2 family glycosyltransferase
MASNSLSVVVVSRNEGDYLSRTVASIVSGLPHDGEIVVVDDGSTDGSSDRLESIDRRVRLFRPPRRLGAAVARNYGARRARGKILVFSDAHVEPLTAWACPLSAVLAQGGVGAAGAMLTSMLHPREKGYGLRFTDAGLNIEWLDLRRATPYPVPLLGGFFLAMRRDIFHAVGGWDEGMETWGMEDLELCVRLWTLGYRCLLVPRVDVAHLDRERNTYPDYQRDWEIGVHNILRLAAIHFGPRRLRSVVRHYAGDSVLPKALARLRSGDAEERRRGIRASRRYDDDWYFRRFGMEI